MSEGKKCFNCGFLFTEETIFCPECGKKQPEEKEESQTTDLKINKISINKSSDGTKNIQKATKSKRILTFEKITNIDSEKETPSEVESATTEKQVAPPNPQKDDTEKLIAEPFSHTEGQTKNVHYVEEDISNNTTSAFSGKSERLEMSDEQYEEAKRELKAMCITEEMESTLFNIISPCTRGFRAFFLGSPGTAKEKTLEKLAKLLYKIGKTTEEKVTWLTFGNIPEKFDPGKFYAIDDMGTAIGQLFNLDDFSGEASQAQHRYKELLERLLKAPRTAYIVLNGLKTEKDGFVTLDPRISYIFDKQVIFDDISNAEVYERFQRQIPDTHIDQLTPEFKDQFIGYLNRNRRFFPFNNQELADYLTSYATKTPKIMLPKEKYNPKTLEETFSKIIGMADVKKQVTELDQYLRVRNNLTEAGAKLPDFNLHMMFLGNPGVGKTSIARIISKTLFDLGFCREEKLVEVTSKDLVGGGQTGIKTNRVIMNALGGVLFVDEAYALSNSCGKAGEEAIAILIKAMVDYRNDLVVMFAGYSLEMKQFVDSNSGISSRISYIFKFEDYSPEELFDIYKLKVSMIGMQSDHEADEAVKKLCKFASGRRNAGNGRFIDNLIQKALTKHALQNLQGEAILTINKKSIPTVEEIMSTSFN